MNAPKSEKPADGKPGQAESAPVIDAAVQGALGRKLRESYDEVVKEEVPPKFMQLLESLKQKEKGEQGGKT
jgi:hypothetical protein